MCLYSNEKFKTRSEALNFKKNLIKTKVDIVVYKVLMSNNYSPYKDFHYEQGQHYTENKLKITTYISDSWSDKPWRLEVEDGLHAFICKERAGEMFGKIVKMTIPKGSIVIYGTRKDIVTDNLIWY